MTSERQQVANGQNSTRSTGAKTAEGKAAVSSNALKHGLQSRAVRLFWESEDEFNAFADAMKQQWQPMGMLEELLVDNLITTQWRLHRLAQMELGILYRSLSAVAKQEALRPEQHAVPLSVAPQVTTEDLVAQPEMQLGDALRHDLSSGAVLTNIDRYRRSLDRAFEKNLDRLTRVQQERWAAAAQDDAGAASVHGSVPRATAALE
ncbi:MAG TPA: hypothetical protein VGL77_14730 [Armatimonadota bacterium]|jgi:hypothetical protein